MAIAVNERVILLAQGLIAAEQIGLASDPPLFGVVQFTGEPAPDEIGVNWENGQQSTFAAAETRLVDTANDPATGTQNLVGQFARVKANHRVNGKVLKTWFTDPDGTNVRTLLARNCDGFYFVARVVDCDTNSAAFSACT